MAAMIALASVKAASKAGSWPGRTGNSACSRITGTTLRGGVLADVRDTELGRTRPYWIALPS